MTGKLGRRRCLTIIGAAAGLSLLPGDAALRAEWRHRWHGSALGSSASIILHHPDTAAVRALIAQAVVEIERLESVFSLYRPDSALATLNATGRLTAPPFELVELLQAACEMARLTGGAFDPTVQPLWNLYAGHFAKPGADAVGPAPALVQAARELVDWRAVEVDGRAIRLARADMALTLNGIAQGYITDRVTDLLRAHGVGHALIDLGEIRGLGRRTNGRPWCVGIREPDTGTSPRAEVALKDAAIATSSPAGTPLDATGRFHHLFDPRTGRCASGARQVTVLADNAMMADALSTTLAVLPADPTSLALLDHVAAARQAWLMTNDGFALAWTRPG